MTLSDDVLVKLFFFFENSDKIRGSFQEQKSEKQTKYKLIINTVPTSIMLYAYIR